MKKITMVSSLLTIYTMIQQVEGIFQDNAHNTRDMFSLIVIRSRREKKKMFGSWFKETLQPL